MKKAILAKVSLPILAAFLGLVPTAWIMNHQCSHGLKWLEQAFPFVVAACCAGAVAICRPYRKGLLVAIAILAAAILFGFCYGYTVHR